MRMTTSTLGNIIESGIRVFYYLDGTEEKLDTPEQELMLSVRGYTSKVERLKAGQRSRDALTRRAAQGLNAGGVVFGYDNVKTGQHTDYKINAEQADVIRRIFRMYAAGYGHATVAKAMNGAPRYAAESHKYFNGERPPTPSKGTGSWAPSSIRQMLYNERYAGVIVWGKARKTYRKGARMRVKADEKNILRAERPDLRIIDPELWQAVQERLAAVRKTYLRDTGGQLWGRPGTGVESRYLLSGLGECGCCGHNITMIGGRSGNGTHRTPLYYYGCMIARDRGPTVCSNGHKARMLEADALVLDTIRARVLTPANIDRTIDTALRLLAERQRAEVDTPRRLQAELQKDRRKLANFMHAIGEGAAPSTVMAEIRALEAAIAAKEHELATLTLAQPDELAVARAKRAFRARLGQFDELLRGDVPVARQALRKLLAGRIAFVPTATGYRLQWALRINSLVEHGYIPMASPRGSEHNSGAVLVASYGTLPRRAPRRAPQRRPGGGDVTPAVRS